ncbi:hypothetical protein [Klebsiella phage phiKp_21]|nr:hypothetical protein [Klebsiella phage phiKp_21]
MLDFMLKSELSHTIGYSIAVLVVFSFMFEKINWLFKTNIYKKCYKVKSFDRQIFLGIMYTLTLYCSIFEVGFVLADSPLTLYLSLYTLFLIPFSLYIFCTKMFNKIIEFRNKLPD